MKKKLKFVIPIVLVLVGGVYKTVLAKPPKLPKPKIAGTVYVMPKEFLLNMADGRYAKLDVSLVLDKKEVLPSAEGGGSTNENYGDLPQEPAVRDVITNIVTDQPSKDLIDRDGREVLKKEILKGIRQNTDVKVDEVLFTDVAVQ
ncbi:MAG TPA: flagellar basal body-associated FliL family protein [Thermoleophilaceae bacterium]|jgi:flagellar FliL protein